MNGRHNNKPLISVIINCFNGEKYLKNAIDSVISQTYKNLSLLNKEKEIHELKAWFKQMKNNQVISSQNNFNKVLLMTYYLETMQSIMKNGFVKSFLMVAKYPFCFNKIKLILALLLPKFLLRKIKNY